MYIQVYVFFDKYTFLNLIFTCGENTYIHGTGFLNTCILTRLHMLGDAQLHFAYLFSAQVDQIR